RMRANPSEFFERMEMVWKYLHTVNWQAAGLGVGSLALILIVPRIFKRVPGSIVALVLGTVAVAVFDLRVTTVGSLFGNIPSGLPEWDLPRFRLDLILPLMPEAVTVALLAALESLLSAVVGDGMIGDRHNSSAELIGLGAANLVVPLVGGIPVTGAIARTATNFRSGGRTPVSAIIHAITVALIVLLAAPLATKIPMATLAAVLFVVAYNMGEWREIRTILKMDTPEKTVWLLTFVLTVMADLTIAVEVGLTLAALLYVYRVSQTTTVAPVTQHYIERGKAHTLQDKYIPPYATILRIHGPFLFGTTDKLAEETADLTYYSSIVILRLRNMTAIDATGMHALKVFHERVTRSGRDLILCGARQQPATFLRRGDFIEIIGEKNIVPHVQAALDRAREIHDHRSLHGGLF
ncbi:MAG: SulP family inorganic anion transporter, partial [Vicinamibacterales bacterium]|nr:SulP family inorganic anion transporter [Vicinamibacterales bacterium]